MTRDYLRLIDKILDPGACWEWRGQRDQGGYGKFTMRDDFASAHRTAYEMFIGPIPDGLEIDHLCDNPSCVNPSHLKAVTPRQNWIRSGSFSAANARKTHCDHGHVFDEANTRLLVDAKGRQRRVCRACVRENQRRYRKAKTS